MRRYRLQSLEAWIEGAYYTEAHAIADLSNQLLEVDGCYHSETFKLVVLKVKERRKQWAKLKDLMIYPTKEEHWRTPKKEKMGLHVP